MASKSRLKYVHEGQYVAEVMVSLEEDETGWGPYLSIDDTIKLDEAKAALKSGDLEKAAKYGIVYEMKRIVYR